VDVIQERCVPKVNLGAPMGHAFTGFLDSPEAPDKRPTARRVTTRFTLAAISLTLGLAAGVACGGKSHPSVKKNIGSNDRVTATVTTNGHVTTIVTGP
jgi:hypothetical protein